MEAIKIRDKQRVEREERGVEDDGIKDAAAREIPI